MLGDAISWKGCVKFARQKRKQTLFTQEKETKMGKEASTLMLICEKSRQCASSILNQKCILMVLAVIQNLNESYKVKDKAAVSIFQVPSKKFQKFQKLLSAQYWFICLFYFIFHLNSYFSLSSAICISKLLLYS